MNFSVFISLRVFELFGSVDWRIFIKFWTFYATISLNVIFCPFLSLLSWDSNYMNIGTVNVVPRASKFPFIFFIFFSLFFRLVTSVDLFSTSPAILKLQLSAIMNFSFELYFSISEFSFCSLSKYHICVLIENLHLFIRACHSFL